MNENPDGLDAAAGALADGVAVFDEGVAPNENPPVEDPAVVPDAALLLALPNDEDAELVASFGLELFACPKIELPPPVAAAGLPNPANIPDGGADAGVVLEADGVFAPAEAAGVPKEKEGTGGLDAGVVDPFAPPPNKFPLPPLLPAPPKENPPLAAGPPLPCVCPVPEPNRPGAGEEDDVGVEVC